MSATKWITIGIVLITLTIWLAWDIFVASNKTMGDTITEVVRQYSKHSLLIPAMIGIVFIGHFYIIRPWDLSGWVVVGTLLGIGLIWLGFDLEYIIRGKQSFQHNSNVLGFIRNYPIIVVVIHSIIGGVVWGKST